MISASARTAHNIACVRRLQLASYLVTWKLADGHVGAIPTCEVSMAFPFAHAEKRRRTSLTPMARAALHALRTAILVAARRGPEPLPEPLPRCSQGRVIALPVQGGRAVAPEVGTRRAWGQRSRAEASLGPSKSGGHSRALPAPSCAMQKWIKTRPEVPISGRNVRTP